MPAQDSELLLRHPKRRLRRNELLGFMKALIRRVARGRPITCLITDDREMRRLNREFRGARGATDVLSFPSGSLACGGEIAISLDRARAQAAEHGHTMFDEIRILMLHGVLHLRGMDHESDTGQMARAELRWRRNLGLPTGLIERSGERTR